MTTYYTVTGNPISLSRGASSLIRAEYTLVQTGFATVNTEMVLKAPLASPTFTGVPAAPTAAFGTNTTQLATTAFVTGYYAPIASPTFTGTPVAPTAALGTSTTQLATTAFAQTMQDPAFTGTPTVPTASAGTATTQIASCAFVVATSFSAALPGQTGNSGKFVTTDGSNASWAAVTPPQVVRQARTSNTILSAADSQNLIDITSGTFSQTFTAAATLGSGWFVYLRNSGTGLITLDPDGAELIDGLSTFIMYPGECRLVQCTGTAFTSVVLTPFNYTTTATVTFTTPPGYALFGGLLWGGGGGGGYGVTGQITGGGGGGACVPFTLTAAAMGVSKTITIGAGGTAPTSAGVGGTGGTSDIGSTLVTAYGGGGGGGNGAVAYYGGGGGGALSAGAPGNSTTGGLGGYPGPRQVAAATTATIEQNTGFGGAIGGLNTAGANHSAWGGAGGAASTNSASPKAIYGGSGGGGINGSNALVAAGTSMFGGNGGAASVAGTATDGSVPGGGGGATQSGPAAGAGGGGQCIIWGVV